MLAMLSETLLAIAKFALNEVAVKSITNRTEVSERTDSSVNASEAR